MCPVLTLSVKFSCSLEKLEGGKWTTCLARVCMISLLINLTFPNQLDSFNKFVAQKLSIPDTLTA